MFDNSFKVVQYAWMCIIKEGRINTNILADMNILDLIVTFSFQFFVKRYVA